MPSPNPIVPPPSTAHFQLSIVNSRLFCSNSFRITYICKNASVTPLGTHTSKTKDLKPFRITYLQKKGGGRGPVCVLRPVTASCPTGRQSGLSRRKSRSTNHGSRGTDHESPITSHQSPSFLDGCIIGIRPDPCRN